MENRRVLPPLYFEKGVDPRDTAEASRTGGAKDWKKLSIDQRLKHVKDPDEAEDAETRFVTKRARMNKKSMETEMTRPYTMDEITTAQLLKGHPRAQEIVDELFKSNKKTEGGEEFQDGSEDSIGKEGHAPPARPGTIKHEGGNPVPGPNNPGVSAKNASEGEDNDLEKSGVERGTLTDNEPNEFKEGMEEDDTIPEGDEGETAEPAQVGKSFTQDEATLEQLRKALGPERFEEIVKATIGGISRTGYKMGEDPTKAGEGVAGGATPEQQSKAAAEKEMLKKRGMAALTAGLSKKSEGEDTDLEKSEGEDLEKAGKHPQKTERAEWAKDPEEEEREHANKSEESFGLDYNPDVLKAMGLEKGSPSVSKKVSGGKATQILYGSEHEGEVGKRGKPETRYSHPKAKEEKRTRFEPTKGEVTVRTRAKGDKGDWKEKKIGVGEEEKLKNASTSSLDLHKSLDEILAKHRG